jgi:glutaredoxin
MSLMAPIIMAVLLCSKAFLIDESPSTNMDYNGIIKSFPLVVFARNNCPYSEGAISLLKKESLNPRVVYVRNDENARGLFPGLDKDEGTFPIIFYYQRLLPKGKEGLERRKKEGLPPFTLGDKWKMRGRSYFATYGL